MTAAPSYFLDVTNPGPSRLGACQGAGRADHHSNTGKRCNLITVSGVGCGSWVFDDLLGRLPPFDTVARETIVGLAERTASPGRIVERAIRSLTELVESVDRPVILAHSLGAAIALEAVTRTSACGLIVIDAGPRWTPPAQRPAVDVTIELEIVRLLPQAAPAALAESIATWTSGMVTDEEMKARILADLLASSPQGLRETLCDGRKLQLSIHPTHLKVPILVVGACDGREEYESVKAEFERRYAGAPNVTVECVPGSRHFVMLDRPAETTTVIKRFLDEVARQLAAYPHAER